MSKVPMSMRSVRGALALAAVLVAASLPVRAQEVIKIGLAWPLTGALAGFGKDIQRVFPMAEADINVKGINGRKVQLVLEDSRSTPEGGIAAFRKLVEVDKVISVQSIFTNIVTAQIPLSDQLKIPLVSTVEAPGLSARGQYTFQHSAGFANILPVLSQHMKLVGAKRIYAFFPDSSYGELLSPRFSTALRATGAEYADARFKFGQSDYRGNAARAKEYNPDFIIVTGQGTADDGNLIRQLREIGITIPIYPAANVYGIKSWRESVGSYVTGMTMAGPDFEESDPVTKDFLTRFRARYGEDPQYSVGLNYDLLRMIASAVEKAGTDGNAIRNYLANLKDYPSVTGAKVSMDAEHQTRLPVFMLREQGGKLVRIKVGEK